MRVSVVLFQILLPALCAHVCTEACAHAEETSTHSKNPPEIGVTALSVGLFTPDASTGGLAIFLDGSYPLSEDLSLILAAGGGPLSHHGEPHLLTALHGGVRWIILPEHALGCRIGTDLIFNPEHDQSTLLEYGLGLDLEYVYRFNPPFFLMTSIGGGISWMNGAEHSLETSEPFPQFVWTNGIGGEIVSF